MSPLQQLVEHKGRAISVRPGDHLFHQGDGDSRIFLVRNGLLKAYYDRADGKQHIKSFVPEGSIIGSMVAVLDGGSCSFSLMAIESGVIVAMPYGELRAAAAGDLALATALIDFLSTYGKRKEQREHQLLSLSAEERYAVLLKATPDLSARVSQGEVAAYIGVTPQALSRIRRRMGKRAA